MNESRQVEEMAKLDGWSKEGRFWRHLNGNLSDNLGCGQTDYLKDHNAVQRIVDGLDEHTVVQFVIKLAEICQRDCNGDYTRRYTMYATCPQKVEAILKACGKWSDVNDGGAE